MRLLFLLFLIIPAIEIGLFVWIGGMIGPWWVVAIIILTGFIGVAIAKQQGVETLNRIKQQMAYREVPANELIDAACIFIGAVFLFTPGFLTDALGFILVLPITRGPFKRILGILFQRMIAKRSFIYRK